MTTLSIPLTASAGVSRRIDRVSARHDREVPVHEQDTKQSAMQQLAVRWTAAQPTVAAFVGSVLTSRNDAEEVLGRTAAAVVRRWDRYDPSQPFVNWAVGVARVEVLRYRQEKKRERHVFDSDTIERVAAAFERSPDDAGEMRAALRYCVGQLRGRLRDIFEMHYVEGVKPAEIAARLKRSSNAVLVALHRGRSALRRCMSKRLGEPGGAA